VAVTSTFRGVAFPFQKGPVSFPNGATDEVLIADSIFQILSTTRGERVMRPSFGANIHAFVFENNNDSLAQLMETEVRSQLAKFEPRIIVTTVTSVKEDTTITLSIEYIVRLTKNTQTVNIELPTTS